MTSVYRFSSALLVRFLGALLAVLGVLLFVVAALVAALDLPATVLTVAVVLVVAGVLGSAWMVTRMRTLVRLDDTGYRVSLLRGAGVKQARWREVEDVVTATVSGHDCVVLRLKDGRTTTVPVQVLDADAETFLKDLSAHLDRGHGYRRLS